MDKLTGLLSLCVLILAAQAYEDNAPSVAFMCNRPAMYRTAKGWDKDDSTDCMKDPVDILNYCRKVYPTLDVRNVVESSKKVTISKWCGFGHNKCHHEFTVRPFRCLVGSFQSDALLVPEHCLFDHIHDSKECKNYDDWNKTSRQSCEDRGMSQQSFAILQPCGIDRFNGVEFVCCPEEDDIDQFLHKEFEYYSTTQVPSSTTGKEFSTTTTTAATTTTTKLPSSSTTHQVEPEIYDDVVAPNSASDIYDNYLHNVAGQFINEHEFFMKAKTELEKHHHEKVTKMMKEWAEARQHVQDLKSVDPKGAEILNKEITARFQKTYEALELEGIADKKQLVALHQQRVQAGLNEKKRHGMEHYMEVINDEDTDATRILKALQHYVKAEQKDRLHSINHFKHLRDTDPDEAEAVREQTQNHLDLIEARIQQAVDMLNRVPKYEKKIRSQIEDYLQTFQPLDASITKLLSTPVLVEKPVDKVAPTFVDHKDAQVIPSTPKAPESSKTPSSRQPEPVEPSTPVTEAPPKAPETPKKEYYDEEVQEDEHDYVELKQPLHGDGFHDNSLEVNSYIKEERVNPAIGRKFSAPTLAVAIGSVTVFIVIVVGIIVLRKRAQRVPTSHGFVEVDTAASPEEKHVANMQLNGYENPTYKYFEMNGNA